MHRVVILEDTAARIDWFRDIYRKEDFAATDSVSEFLSFVKEAEEAGTLKLVIMDHDLGHLSRGSEMYGTYTFDVDAAGQNGADAARALTTTAPVLIWSINEYGAREIEMILREKGIRTARLSFFSNNFTAIKNTIQRALETP